MKLPENSQIYELVVDKISSQCKNQLNNTEDTNDNHAYDLKTNYTTKVNSNEENNNLREEEKNVFVNSIRLPSTSSSIEKIDSINELKQFISNINSSYCSVKVNLLELTPSQPEKLVLAYSSENKQSYSLREVNNRSDLVIDEYYFSCFLKVRFNEKDNEIFEIFFSTHDNEGNGLLGIEPSDCLKDFTYYGSFYRAVNGLYGRNNYMELVLNKIMNDKGDIILKIVGDYNNLNNVMI